MTPGTFGRRLQEGSLYVLLVLLPFSIAAIEITFGLLLVGWLLERCDPATRAQTLWSQRSLLPLTLAVGLYLAVCALSILISDYPAMSLHAFIEKWLEYLLFFVITADIVRRHPGVQTRVFIMLVCSAFLVVVEGLSQECVGTGLFRGQAMYAHRMTGPYKNPIDLATYLMVIIPILLGYTLTVRGRARWALWGLLALLLVCLARTEALGAWLGLAVGLLVIISRETAVRRVGVGLLAGFLVVGAGVLYGTGHLQEIFSPSELGKVDRLVMWQAAIGMIRDRPVLGHGLNTFMANYLHYWVGGEHQPRYAHNCYLQVAAETGLIGLALFVSLLSALVWRIAAALRRLRSPDAFLLLGMLAGLLAFLFQAGIDTNFYSLRQAALFWVLAGLALGLSESASWPSS